MIKNHELYFKHQMYLRKIEHLSDSLVDLSFLASFSVHEDSLIGKQISKIGYELSILYEMVYNIAPRKDI